MKDVAEETVVNVDFQSENIVAPLLEGLSNVLHIIQMDNTTGQYTQILPWMRHKMQQMQTLMS